MQKVPRTKNKITTRAEYEACRAAGIDVLGGRYDVPISLRVELQRELFGTGHTPAENEKFYRYCWEHKRQICEECMKPLRSYSAVFVSHILTRGAHPEMAHDPRNVNILCLRHHNQWENGNRKSMRIYAANQIQIAELREDYAKLR